MKKILLISLFLLASCRPGTYVHKGFTAQGQKAAVIACDEERVCAWRAGNYCKTQGYTFNQYWHKDRMYWDVICN